ncbi:MAG TPA: AIR synthase-related protein, partial [Candidatus Binatus sp.]|nr:AIR synthase-related protein [Candidatus Binatus sp.]
RVVQRARLKLDSHIGELGCTLGEGLLRPTLIYARVVVELFERFRINGLANITGGGVVENLPRVMPNNARANIQRGSWPIPPIFGLIQRLGGISRSEMDRTFNNGLGMVAIVSAREADRVVAHLRRRKYGAHVVGEVTRGKRGVSFV